MFTIDQLVAAFLLGAVIFTLIGHAAGYGKGLRVGKARTLAHIRALVDRAHLRPPRRPRRDEADARWDLFTELDSAPPAAPCEPVDSDEWAGKPIAPRGRNEAMEWAAWNA